ncbi:glycosyltransferase family 4 protein [Microbacterium esteraromaticum]|uniref:D-inositol 3-phosphate glycosyltransferase n=1 Tax=Microbacterium esteraromaticum TaxID=57043 RepID=A0A7D8AIW3_9MICO|nr:glycosyltransferase family 4 protein [Microbacterium esteraromaticum]QMU98683.1 glycosyltransferase family 4 protein [Microbacterium esteraromaticum]
MQAVDHVTLATNNGAIGGGEVMLLRIAEALRELSVEVTVVAPATPGGVAEAAKKAGFETVQLHVKNRLSWMWQLRRWDAKHRKGVLWCNGLVPATATWGHRDRIVHLHQHPDGLHRVLSALSRVGAVATLVPSAHMLRSVPGARVMPNWTALMPRSERSPGPDAPFTVGFLGRLGPDKGVHVLAQAMRLLDEQDPGRYRLALAGEPVFVAKSKVEQVEQALAEVDALVDRVGWVRPSEFFDTIDLLVVPSVWEEPFGLVAAEAMSAQVPVVVSDAGALPEIVGSETGMVTPKGDAPALAEKIARIASGNEGVDVAVQHARWAENYSPTAGVVRVRELLDTLGA